MKRITTADTREPEYRPTHTDTCELADDECDRCGCVREDCECGRRDDTTQEEAIR